MDGLDHVYDPCLFPRVLLAATQVKTYIYLQATEPPEHEQDIKKLVGDGITVRETSSSERSFRFRELGGWILRNAQADDIIGVTSVKSLGKNLEDICRTMDHLCTLGVQLTITNFKGWRFITLKGRVLELVVDSMLAAAGTARLNKARGKWVNSKWGMKIIWERKGDTIHRSLAWDNEQLKHCADITRRLLINKEPVDSIIADYHGRGIKDHTGNLFGVRKRGETRDRFQRAAESFLRDGEELKLPPEWLDASRIMADRLRHETLLKHMNG